MNLLDLSLEYRVLIGVSAMVLLFVSFLVSFIGNQRRKLQYHLELHALNEARQRELQEQNAQLEQRVQDRTREISRQKEELQHSLAELKATQLQLIQKEKMASLGELTAGIAHEIQNPLNFVNNFSEVSKELAEEMEKELAQGNPREALSLAGGLKENLDKIAQHGKRAGAIVKGMLQHATASSAEKEPVDINTLAGEYLRLTNQTFGIRHKGFEVHLQTAFDSGLGQVPAYPLDLVRVLVNLYNNAFYALYQKHRANGTGYQPVLFVGTRQLAGAAQIRVKDNGTGIPPKNLSRIFQPFFTTKPTGEGTGLGLSLSYDIITKAHGGTLTVTSLEGEGAEFIVELPV